MTRSTRSTRLALLALPLALVASLGGSPASAEAVVYDGRAVRSLEPGAAPETAEFATLDVPTGYDPDRRNWHKVSFVEERGAGRVITVDLDPHANTLARLKAQRAAFADKHADSYRELSFTVIKDDAKARSLFRARWAYTVSTENTGDVSPFVTVYLKQGNRLKVVGSMADREQVRSIRDHVIRSFDRR
jgi:hypothetical protein